MKNKIRRFTLLALVTSSVVLTGWLRAAPQQTTTPNEKAWSELLQSMHKMHFEMKSINQSGDNDVDFAKMMLPHHQAALDMARTELMYGKDAQMRRLAQEIITDQQSEIQLMQLWLKQHESSKPKSEE